MRADRLLSILMLLQTKGRMTAHDLATRLEVSERTIYRDLEALSMAGIPIYAERGPGGGCSLVDGYQTRLTGLTEEEVKALFLTTIAGPLADLGLSKALDDALLKISATLPAASRDQAEQIRQRVHLDPTWWYHNDDQNLTLQTIQQALWQDRVLCLTYLGEDGTESRQLVEPYGLVAKAHVWYLVACYRGMQRVFRLSHIQVAELTAQSFVRSYDFDLANYWSTYCAQSEALYAQYAGPLRLAPDEAQRLSQIWYTEQAADNVVAMNADARTVALRLSQRKKQPSQERKAGRSVCSSHSSTHHARGKQLFLLNGAGEWQELGRSREEKKRLLNARNDAQQSMRAQEMPSFPTKKTDSNRSGIKKGPLTERSIKKRNSTAQGSAIHLRSRPDKKKSLYLTLLSA